MCVAPGGGHRGWASNAVLPGFLGPRPCLRKGGGYAVGATQHPPLCSCSIEAKNETTNVGSDKSRQLLGIKGALDDEVPLWKIRVQLTKPVTWVPLIWGVACGAAASGNFHWYVVAVRGTRPETLSGTPP